MFENFFDCTNSIVKLVISGNLPSLKAAIKQYPNLVSFRENMRGASILIIAAQCGHLKMVQWLVNEGDASIKETDAEGYTAVIQAAFEGLLETVQWLLTEGG